MSSATRSAHSQQALAASAINVGDAVRFKADSQTIADGTISKVQDAGRRLQVEFTDAKGAVRKRWITNQQILSDADVKSQVLAAVKKPILKHKAKAAADQLAEKLERRQKINDGEIQAPTGQQRRTVFNPYTEFPMFSREEIKNYQAAFKKYDTNGSKSMDQNELTKLFEDLGCPQTHLGIRKLIKEVDLDKSGEVSFREFLFMFKNAKGIEGLDIDVAQKASIEVNDEGVSGAKNFFAAKIAAQSASNKAEDEIKAERDMRRQAKEEQKRNREAFKAKQNLFK